jgi:subtilisin-like proprotein convertase family protein
VSPAWCGDLVAVPWGGRVEVFELTDPSSAVSPARRLDAPASARLGGPVAEAGRPARVLEEGWSLTSRVLVRAEEIDGVLRAIDDPGVVVFPIEGLSGWFVVEAGRVDRAVSLASLLPGVDGVGLVEMDALSPVRTRGVPDDTFFNMQWHLRNTALPGVDIGAVDAWDLGYTGTGVVICIVEGTGLQLNHPDLVGNINLGLAQSSTLVSSHMTSVAGIAAAVGNNGQGVAGVAYNAQLSQALIGSDMQTAGALLRLNNDNHIKNNSWGPTDNGLIDPMPAVIRDALISSTSNGRNGLGTVFVWAGGNGQASNDRVDYDPYASSRYTIAVGAVGNDDRQAGYSEPGSSLLLSAYSNGGSLGITTTASNSGYSFTFGGTSASSPIVAGVVALMLEANPGLTWRDVQHILVDSVRPIDPDDERWTMNGAGRLVNEGYGFGMVDAPAAVLLAEGWEGVGPEVSVSSGVIAVNEAAPDNDASGIERTVFIPDNVRIESVELVMNVQTTMIGDLEISITSPDGTRSLLARQRTNDFQDNLVGTVFTSMRHWGERSAGHWVVKLADRRTGAVAFWQDFQLRFHGESLGAGPCGPVDLGEPYGILDLNDISAFIVAFQSGSSSADLAPPFGTLNEDDIAAFVFQFPQGCP